MQLTLRVIYHVTAAQCIKAVLLTRMLMPSQSQRIRHLTNAFDCFGCFYTRFLQMTNFSIQKTNIEWRVVNNQFSALDKFQELWPNISDLRFVSQKLGADAMNLLGPLINITLWVNVFMELSTAVAAIHEFHAA